MIRETVNYDSDEQHAAACQEFPGSGMTWLVSPGLPEGTAIWPAYADEDLSRLSALSVLAFHPVPAASVVEFSTADALGAGRNRLRPDNEFRWLEDTRAYLHCLTRGVQPGPHHREAWDRFFLVYTRRIRRAAESYGLSAIDAEDCVQDVWIVILDVLRRSGHDPRWDRFACWMRGLIRNQVVNFVRGLARRPDRGAQSLDDAVLGRDLEPEATYERNERRRLVRHVLIDLEQQVSATNYRLVHFRWIEQCEVAEVAARLDLTSEQVRYRHHRVKKRLRRLLEHHGERPETGWGPIEETGSIHQAEPDFSEISQETAPREAREKRLAE